MAYTPDTRIRINAKEMLGGTTQKSANTDAAVIKGYKTKLDNFRNALKAFGKGVLLADNKSVISSEVIATSLFSLRRDAEALEITPSSPELEKMYADAVKNIKAADPKAEVIGYYAFLATGREAKGRSHEMDRVLARTGDKAGVFAYHQHTVEQYQALKHAIATWEAIEAQQ